MECANDRLWGTGVNLNHDDCLKPEKWISPGILGKILEEIRDSNVQNRVTDSAVPPVSTVNETAESMQTDSEPNQGTCTGDNASNNSSE